MPLLIILMTFWSHLSLLGSNWTVLGIFERFLPLLCSFWYFDSHCPFWAILGLQFCIWSKKGHLPHCVIGSKRDFNWFFCGTIFEGQIIEGGIFSLLQVRVSVGGQRRGGAQSSTTKVLVKSQRDPGHLPEIVILTSSKDWNQEICSLDIWPAEYTKVTYGNKCTKNVNNQLKIVNK